ncbi:uncharacterized protein CDAR_8661 [Caerostris darwini]|uniref:Uncharacterized protein n=1 Tax=Caerostris darwini TaxID=1538125 RepID=A0AAV4R477_9ARAC|nr:uncharacterized protein CDAR_8661 [Caerostris darwini]
MVIGISVVPHCSGCQKLAKATQKYFFGVFTWLSFSPESVVLEYNGCNVNIVNVFSSCLSLMILINHRRRTPVQQRIPDPDNVLSPAQTTNEFIRPLENPYPPLPPVDEVEYGPGAASAAANIPRPKTYAVVVSRLAGHRWLKLKLEPPREKTDETPVEELGPED